MTGELDAAQVACLTVAGVFAWSSVAKGRDLRAASDAMAANLRLPERLAAPVVGTLVAAESGIAALCLTPCRTAALAGALTLCAAFCGYAAYVVVTGRKADCACFGSDTDRLTVSTLGRNLVLLTLTGIALSRRDAPVDPTSVGSIVGQVLLAAYATVVLRYWTTVFARAGRAGAGRKAARS